MTDEIKDIPQEDDNIVILEDENGTVIRFEFLELVEIDATPYAILLPLEDEDEDCGCVIVEVVDLGLDTEHYDAVTDKALLDRIFNQFQADFGDKYQFE